MFGAFARFARGIDSGDPDGRYLLTCLLLAVVGGFADAGSYVLAGSFTGHITGNALLTAIGIVERDWSQVVACAVAVAAFVTGTAVGTVWPHGTAGGRVGTLLTPLLVEAAIISLALVGCSVIWPGDHAVFLGSVCFALGLQNGTLNRFGPVSVHSTCITGMSTSLIVALLGPKPDAKRAILPLIISAFLCGAFIGAFFARRDGVGGFVVLLALLTPTIILAALAGRKAE